MSDNFQNILTPFDQSVTSHSLQMVKLLLPFLPPHMQRFLAVYIKFMEFQNTLASFHSFPVCQDPMEELKKMIPDSAWESFETLENMMNMMDMFSEMQKEGEEHE